MQFVAFVPLLETAKAVDPFGGAEGNCIEILLLARVSGPIRVSSGVLARHGFRAVVRLQSDEVANIITAVPAGSEAAGPRLNGLSVVSPDAMTAPRRPRILRGAVRF